MKLDIAEELLECIKSKVDDTDIRISLYEDVLRIFADYDCDISPLGYIDPFLKDLIEEAVEEGDDDSYESYEDDD